MARLPSSGDGLLRLQPAAGIPTVLPLYTDSWPYSAGPPTQHSMGLDGAGYMGLRESGQRWKVIIGTFLSVKCSVVFCVFGP